MAKNEDNCPICKQPIDVICSGYHRSPFIDGRCYAKICYVCYCVPKFMHYDEKQDKFVSVPPGTLYDVNEMVDFGFEKQESQVSIKAVKKAMKNRKIPKVVPEPVPKPEPKKRRRFT